MEHTIWNLLCLEDTQEKLRLNMEEKKKSNKERHSRFTVAVK